MEYLADTVAVIRHFSRTGKIGGKAKTILTGADQGDNIVYISIISMVEIMYLTDANRIPLDFPEVKKRILELDNYQVIDLNMGIVDVARAIKGLELHDRLIVATAKYLNLPILTTDKVIRESNLLEVIWE